MSDPPPYALEVTPESSLQFTLNRTPSEPASGGAPPSSGQPNEPTSRCTMTLRHTGGTREHLAFKVKTTQPRRYLVRPNQGVVAPNTTETVSILLVERDKQILLHSYDRLGQSALDHSKDKFLVQSCAVDDEFAERYMAERARTKQQQTPTSADGSKASGMSKEMADSLTSMWNSAASDGDVPIYNKKLHVRHVVPPGDAGGPSPPAAAAGATAAAAPPLAEQQQQQRPRSSPGGGPSPPASSPAPDLRESSKASADGMSPEQMFAEIASLRRKYDELVSFSVNLTAERDILNNTLEQARRDLNRERAERAAVDGGGGGGGGTMGGAGEAKAGGGLPLAAALAVALVCFLAGIRAGHSGAASFLGNVPLLSSALGMEGDEL